MVRLTLPQSRHVCLPIHHVDVRIGIFFSLIYVHASNPAQDMARALSGGHEDEATVATEGALVSFEGLLPLGVSEDQPD